MENLSTSLMTVEEACEELMVGRNSIYALLSSGKLKGFKLGRVWKIPRDSIKQYILSQSKMI